jgi:predicted nucleic acid binding AN1-type Zn finger protein
MEKVKGALISNYANNPPQNIQAEKNKSKKKRCLKCNKKLGLLPFNCKCGNLFCSACRHPEAHECKYDFRAQAKEQILKENPVIKFNKINPI